MKVKPREAGWLCKYTLLYAIVAVPIALILMISGKTFLWCNDAYSQLYPALNYTGEAVRRLLAGEGFRMVDLSLGQGLDVIGTMAYYGLFNPFQWLAAFFSESGMDFCYTALVFLYFYLSGLLMCAYTRTIRLFAKGDGWITATSGIIFAYCGYHSMSFLRYPFFACGSIFFVLMLICIERILQGKSILPMSLAVMLMLFANFYFGFKTTVLAVIYVVIRLAARLRDRGLRQSAIDGFRLLGGYLIGFMLSMMVLLPAAIAFFESGRTDVAAGYSDSLLLYPWGYYLKLLIQLCVPYDFAGFWSFQSFSPLAFFALAILFFRRGKDGVCAGDSMALQMKTGFLIAMLLLCVPAAGKFFNGMGYVINRWSYGYSFVVCLITAWALPQILSPQFKGRRRLAVMGFVCALVLAIYGLIAHKLPSYDSTGNAGFESGMGGGTANLAGFAGSAAMGVCALILLFVDRKIHLNYKGVVRCVALMSACCCLAYNVGYAFSAIFDSTFYREGVDGQIRNHAASAVACIEDEDFYRVDAGSWADCHAAILDYNGVGYYWSVIPEVVSGHYIDLELSSVHWPFRLDGLGSDTYLSALAGVGYALRQESDTPIVLPYGYEAAGQYEKANGGKVNLYDNSYALPLGYVFADTLPRSEYDLLTPVEKREALIRCAVIEEGEGLSVQELELPVEEIPWTVRETNGIELTENEMNGGSGDTISLDFEAPADSMVYLCLENVEPSYVEDGKTLRISTMTDAGLGRMFIIMPGGVFAYDQTGCCHSLGYTGNGMSDCVLRFDSAANVSFDELRIFSVPMSYYREQIQAIRDRGGWDAQLGNNCARGKAVLNEGGVLQISLPFSKGWKAYINGEEAEIVRCGGMYMGLKLDAGEHDIELRYMTPGLKAGICISLLAAALCVAVGLAERRLSKK